MKQELKVPSVGESVTSGILGSWLKKNGDYVDRGDEVFELETDKATMAVPASDAGVLTIEVEEGTEVEIGQVVGYLDTEATKETGNGSAPGSGPSAVKSTAESGSGTTTGSSSAPASGTPAGSAGSGALSPAAQRLAEENNTDPSSIRGSGKDGRVTKEDVQAALAQRTTSGPGGSTDPSRGAGAGTKSVASPSSSAGAISGPSRASAAPAPVSGALVGGSRRVPMTTLRKRIAENLVRSQSQSAHLTTFNEIDMGAVMELRKKYRDSFEKRHGVRLGFMSFFLKASQTALEAFPEANASVDETDIIYHDFQNIGVAVSTDRGLLTPVVRNVGTKSFAEIETEIASFAVRARDKKLSPDELVGATFTITNGGVFGSLLSTPIPSPPQSAILGMHTIQERPVALNGQVVIRPMMYVALTYDHRIIDGREAIGFLVKIKEQIEDPAQMLLGL